MKKIIMIFIFMIFNFANAKEETPLLLDSPITRIDYIEDDNSLINYDGMKKSQKIKDVQDEIEKRPRIKLDTRQINHQRALDYTTKFNDSMMLPAF